MGDVGPGFWGGFGTVLGSLSIIKRRRIVILSSYRVVVSSSYLSIALSYHLVILSYHRIIALSHDRQRDGIKEEQDKDIDTYASLHVARFPFLLGKVMLGSFFALGRSWGALGIFCSLLG